MDEFSDSFPDKLEEQEVFWRDRYHFFKSKGYVLRPRYHPKWQASWKCGVELFPDRFEDSITQKTRKRPFSMPDKRERTERMYSSNEWTLGLILMKNHCVPIVAVFSDDQDPWYRYIVMPVLRPFDEPNFTSVGEIIDFVNQTLEGLVYMHERNIAHRDCAAENILMDGSNLYKDGWHPMDTWRARDGGDLPNHPMRSEVEIEYYFIDFGLSTEFSPEQRERSVTGHLGRIQAPEQASGLPYDPFKLDMYYLGHVYQTKIVNEFRGLEVLGDLVRLMMKPDPKDRPSASETATLWSSLQSLPSIPPRWTRLRSAQGEGSVERIMNDALDVVGMVRGSIGF